MAPSAWADSSSMVVRPLNTGFIVPPGVLEWLSPRTWPVSCTATESNLAGVHVSWLSNFRVPAGGPPPAPRTPPAPVNFVLSS